VGPGRRKDKHNYPRPKAEAKDNVNHGARQRGARHEETVGRTHHCADTEKGVPGSNGTTLGASNESHCTWAEEAKTYMAQTQAECARLISDEIAVQALDTLKEKTMQAQTQAMSSGRSSKRSPERSMTHTKVRWLGMSHMSVLGACWKHTKVERKAILGRKACTRKATAGRKRSMCACMEDLMTLGLGFLQYTVMVLMSRNV
jgi:hypothetical protein